MKGSHPVITLLGSNSGNNLGDAAIMSSILDNVSKTLPGVEFIVPTTNPSFTDTHYATKYNVRGLNVMPWTGSIRLLGIPTFRAFLRSDCALICDGIIFGKKLFNPLFNFLITLFFLVPLAKLARCKLVCYSTGIGPFPNEISRKMARYLINNCDLVLMREEDSIKLCKEIGVTQPVSLTGDAAFINPVSSDERATEVAKELEIDFSRPTIGVNVTSYMDVWLSSSERFNSETRGSFVAMLARSLENVRKQVEGDLQVVVFSTHPMDEPKVLELAALANAKVVLNRLYLSHDIQALMRRCTLFVGMRFHSLILASAVGAPIVALVYAPKVRGFMRLLKCEDVALEFASLNEEILTEKLLKAWNGRKELLDRQQPVIEDLKRKAHEAEKLLATRYFPGVARS
jgi:polysaccharide pyruvyl transferase WcaK-like protein